MGLLRAMGFTAEVFSCPDDFLASELRHNTSCLISDMRMPGMSGLELQNRLVEAGTPAGVINVVNGDPAGMGQAMLDHPACRKISFTGSVRVGRVLMDGASRTFTRLSLELGGNAPVIILPDADLDAVVPARPDAIMLPKAEGGAGVIHADAKLTAREAIAGLPDGHIKIVAIATETAAA